MPLPLPPAAETAIVSCAYTTHLPPHAGMYKLHHCLMHHGGNNRAGEDASSTERWVGWVVERSVGLAPPAAESGGLPGWHACLACSALPQAKHSRVRGSAAAAAVPRQLPLAHLLWINPVSEQVPAQQLGALPALLAALCAGCLAGGEGVLAECAAPWPGIAVVVASAV